MLRAEARWFRKAFAEVGYPNLTPMLSIGSGDATFRRSRQPWIEEQIFAPLSEQNVGVLHHELTPADGVDLVGDLTDAGFVASLATHGFRSVLCANVLEHIDQRQELIDRLHALVTPGTTLFISVPHAFPHHPDPIDTMFRPTPDELVAAFPGFAVIEAELVQTDSLLKYWLASHDKVASVRNGLSARTSKGGDSKPVRSSGWFRMAFLYTSVSCAVLRRRE